jgi:predicted protein tyrosine phosphatase
MDSLTVNIQVVSRFEANSILTSAHECSKITFLVSIGGLEDQLPAGYSNVPSRLRLVFGDTLSEEDGASVLDIQCLIDLAKKLKGSRAEVLIHCEAGVSRSTAAALIMYTCLLGQGSEREAMDRVLSQRPIANPNRRMVELADKLLGREGRLMSVID